jgi:hypothetical protein
MITGSKRLREGVQQGPRKEGVVPEKQQKCIRGKYHIRKGISKGIVSVII